MSSAGLRLIAPPQTMQPPSRSTTRRIAALSRSTGAMVSMVSAVPAGEVIARDDVFGIMMPSAATIATMIGVVRLPGRPPTQCLSATVPAGHFRRSPASTIAWVSASTSWWFERRRGAGGQERRQVDVGILAVDDVADDGMEGRLA